MISYESAKQRLALLWLSASGLMSLLLIVASLLGKFQVGEVDRTIVLWQWFLPTFVPTLSMIIAMYVADARKLPSDREVVRRFHYRVTMGLSLFYFLVVFLVYAVGAVSDTPNFRAFDVSNLFLAPLQGLVSASLAVFFFQR